MKKILGIILVLVALFSGNALASHYYGTGDFHLNGDGVYASYDPYEYYKGGYVTPYAYSYTSPYGGYAPYRSNYSGYNYGYGYPIQYIDSYDTGYYSYRSYPLYGTTLGDYYYPTTYPVYTGSVYSYSGPYYAW